MLIFVLWQDGDWRGVGDVDDGRTCGAVAPGHVQYRFFVQFSLSGDWRRQGRQMETGFILGGSLRIYTHSPIHTQHTVAKARSPTAGPPTARPYYRRIAHPHAGTPHAKTSPGWRRCGVVQLSVLSRCGTLSIRLYSFVSHHNDPRYRDPSNHTPNTQQIFTLWECVSWMEDHPSILHPQHVHTHSTHPLATPTPAPCSPHSSSSQLPSAPSRTPSTSARCSQRQQGMPEFGSKRLGMHQ